MTINAEGDPTIAWIAALIGASQHIAGMDPATLAAAIGSPVRPKIVCLAWRGSEIVVSMRL
ncbi:hypothetical protein [Nonomuraea sp. NPDC049784]|uniref:hypothetical protein n=1 Tax=Nonomuraea sp. NPDC049784 TaxID=3154361 RepID=UPI0033DB0A6E